MLREIYYQFLPYRSIIVPFLVVCAIFVPGWLIFRLYRLRARSQPLSVPREILLLVFVVYLAGLVAATLTPNGSDRMLAAGRGGIELRPNLTALTCSSRILPRGTVIPRFCGYNAKGNLALFFPLGILIPLIWTKLRFRKAILIAIALSISIEIVQYISSAWGSYRRRRRQRRRAECCRSESWFGTRVSAAISPQPRSPRRRACLKPQAVKPARSLPCFDFLHCLRTRLRFCVERDCFSNECLQSRRGNFLAFDKIDCASRVSFETGIE